MGVDVRSSHTERRRWTVTFALAPLAMLLASCTIAEGRSFVVEPGTRSEVEDVDDVAWRHLGMVEDVLPGRAAAAAVENADELAAVWRRYGFEGEVPDVDLTHRIVLLLGQPDDACPDELVDLEVVDAQLQLGWLPPPGGCRQPLILRLHAVEVHRGHLPARFTVALDVPYDDELTPVTLELAPYEGDAPAPPAPPEAMSDAEVDEVFAGHPVRRCDPSSQRWWQGEVAGALSDDPDVAAAQRERAAFGVASDEATVRDVLDHPDRVDDYGFALLPAELEEDIRASELMEQLMGFLRAEGWDTDRDLTPVLARDDGIRPSVLAGADEDEAVRELLDARFGPGTIEVLASPWDPAAVAAAQDALTALLAPADGGWSLAWLSGPPGPAEIGIVDPTREALDAIADLVDPELVCVEVLRSGVQQLEAPVGRG
jgi:hypothetical protein